MISIVLPVHNSEATIEESISSIVDQTFTNFELIVINNASTDQSTTIIDRWMGRDKRIRLVDEARKGLAFAFNRGMSEVRGEWVARMDADDIAHPERFQRQIQFMQENPKVDALGTQMDMFGSKAKRTDFPLTHDGIVIDFCFRNCMAHPTLLIRRERIESLLYPSGFDISDDYIQWVRWSKRYQFSNLPDALLKYRVHSSQITRSKADIVKKTEKLVLKEAFKNQGILLADIDIDVHWRFCRQMEFQSGIEVLREARILNKLWKKTPQQNEEGRNIILKHFNRLIDVASVFPIERTFSYIASSISDAPLNLFRKSRRTKLKSITGL